MRARRCVVSREGSHPGGLNPGPRVVILTRLDQEDRRGRGGEGNDLNHLRAILGALGPCESSSDDVIRMKAEKVRRELTDAVEIRKE